MLLSATHDPTEPSGDSFSEAPNESPASARSGRTAALAGPGWMKREEAIMGTAISVELWADDARTGAAACAAVMGEMHRIDRRMSPHKEASELSRINREAASARCSCRPRCSRC
ncbi:MAG: hypothetical protein U1F67_07255 [Rubrivivax sp.]